MSGICGVVFRDRDRQVNGVHLGPMLRALDVLGQGEDFTVTLGPASLATQSFPGRLGGVAELALHGRPLALAFHGNLYNLRELCISEEQNANPCMGLLYLYLKEGMAFVQRLRGEFALALWDGPAETLHLATDRFRVHPILYYQDRDKLVFASRMKGILACPFAMSRTIDPEAIVDVVASSVIPTPKTILQEVKKLPPGHALTYHKGTISLSPYWEINFLQSDRMGEAELTRHLKACFAEAVSVRLEADTGSHGIGTFLSGGVDSSTVTGVLTRLAKHPIKSFSIGFEEERFNEINYARIAAQAFGAEHHEYFVTPRDTYAAIPVLLEAFDEPFANASAVPTYFCAKMAREQGVEILYAGDGGDELFAGNERYATQHLLDYYGKIPFWIREPLVKPLISILSNRLAWEPFVKGERYIQRASIPYPERLSSYAVCKVVPLAELLDDSLLEALGRDYDPYAMVNRYYYQAPACRELDRQLYIDLKIAISDNDLFKVARMTEAVGITTRYPFLDHRLAEFAARVPARMKMRGRNLRSFFKRAYADLLPSVIRTKKKHGFGLPIPIWLRTDRLLNEMMRDCVLSNQTIQRGYFRQKTVESLVASHRTDTTSFYGTILWNLTILELWLRQYNDSLPTRLP